MRVIAVDWSGRATGAEEAIWLAEVVAGEVVRLENGRSREAMAGHLADLAQRDPALVIGLDFAFSFPAWFVNASGCGAGQEIWSVVAREGERWLRDCPLPFWGRPGVKRPDLPEHFRRTDRAVPAVGGIRPKSVFQVGGAGAVGTGSIRGMPMLAALRAAGCAIWPFDAPRLPLVLEIYPRALTGPVAKRVRAARASVLASRYPGLRPAVRRAAEGSEDAFDALVSALEMHAHAAEFTALPERTAPEDRQEGAIWLPRGGTTA